MVGYLFIARSEESGCCEDNLYFGVDQESSGDIGWKSEKLTAEGVNPKSLSDLEKSARVKVFLLMHTFMGY